MAKYTFPRPVVKAVFPGKPQAPQPTERKPALRSVFQERTRPGSFRHREILSLPRQGKVGTSLPEGTWPFDSAPFRPPLNVKRRSNPCAGPANAALGIVPRVVTSFPFVAWTAACGEDPTCHRAPFTAACKTCWTPPAAMHRTKRNCMPHSALCLQDQSFALVPGAGCAVSAGTSPSRG